MLRLVGIGEAHAASRHRPDYSAVVRLLFATDSPRRCRAADGKDYTLQKHSDKVHSVHGISEVADFLGSVCISVSAIVLYIQSTRRFPSWTSRVRTPSPAPFNFNNIAFTDHPKCAAARHRLPLNGVMIKVCSDSRRGEFE